MDEKTVVEMGKEVDRIRRKGRAEEERRYGVFYVAWYGEGDVPDVKVFGQEVGKRLKTKLKARGVYVLVSVRKPWEAASEWSASECTSEWSTRRLSKVSVLFSVEGAVIPVRVREKGSSGEKKEYGVHEEYAGLVGFFGGKSCLDIRLDEFQVVRSEEYAAVYGAGEDMKLEMWRMLMTSRSLGGVSWSDCEVGEWGGDICSM